MAQELEQMNHDQELVNTLSSTHTSVRSYEFDSFVLKRQFPFAMSL